MDTSNYLYYHGEHELHGFLAYKDSPKGARPAVLIAHDWTGRNEFACNTAERLAHLGYIALAIDMYGQGRLGETRDEKMALMQPLIADRLLLRERIQAAYDAVVSMPDVDINRIAAVGFCFGGLCVLDLARMGTELKGVISFHGLLNKPHDIPNETIKAKVLALHGYEDPMVTSQELHAFCEEMTISKVDWQIHTYGHVMHAFTNPEAHEVHYGTVYNPFASQRAMLAMQNFLEEIFKL